MSHILAPQLIGPVGGNKTLLQIIQDLGLDTNLELCLDAGDANSYPGSGQKWLDTDTGGYDFFRGADGTATTDDPTFNGSAGGKSANEYWSFDGGDFFRYDAANETWMQNIHKAGATYTFICVCDPDTVASQFAFVGTDGQVSTNVGFRWVQETTPHAMSMQVTDGSGALALNTYSGSVVVTASTMNFMAVSVSEAGGASASHFRANALTGTFDGAYDTPSSSDATYTMEIAALGNGTNPANNLVQIPIFAAFSAALTTTQTGNIRTEIMARFA